ncbi:MAG TPA: ribose-5-phosphate isomerase RpiA [Polyangiaceae bacterium]|nr:ribose-5-phosphate isomerase RpiA [Polyangiaceae bacterium]
MTRDEAKRLAARAALDLLPNEGVVGLGSGSTAELFIDEVGALVRAGRKLTGVPTSEASRARAERNGIPLLPDTGPWTIDVCVDGADEVSDALDLIKGGGGCHTREKIVNAAAKTNVIVVDDSKLSRKLGEKWAVPVEILPFGRLATVRLLERFGKVVLREAKGSPGTPWMTDAGNFIYDVRAGVIERPAELESELCRLPGVVDTGLFVGRANVVLVAGETGLKRLDR